MSTFDPCSCAPLHKNRPFLCLNRTRHVQSIHCVKNKMTIFDANTSHTTSPNASTISPRKIMSPRFSSSNLRSVPMNAKSTGCRHVQACSNTCTNASSPSSSISLRSILSVEITGLLRLYSTNRFLQPVPATNADMIHANGPAPGYPQY